MIGILGGTFDPIHNGHLHAAETTAAALGLERVHLVLAAHPTHRAEPFATQQQRWDMLRLAVAGNELLRADDRESRRDAASYTFDTLTDVRMEYGRQTSVVWLLGWDAYRQLTTWYRWRELLSLAHLAVMRRPGSGAELDADMRDFTKAHCVSDATLLHGRPGGLVVQIDAPMLSISSTDIRARLQRAEDVGELLPPAVWTYIKKHHPYRGQTRQ